MSSWKARGLSFGLLAGACALGLDVGSAAAAPEVGDPSDYTALVLGHAFLPTPDPTYISEVIGTYVDNPAGPGTVYPVIGDGVAVTTPQTDYGYGLMLGAQDLAKAVNDQLSASSNSVVIAGYSMGATVESQYLTNLSDGTTPLPTLAEGQRLDFVLGENLNNPNGGIFTRFPDNFPSLTATPTGIPGTDIHIDDYTIQYSGASDFPQYYGNLFADSNASAGYVALHPYLLPFWPQYFDVNAVNEAVLQPVSSADIGTDYYLIPTQTLPMLDFLELPGTHSAFVDMINPDMRVLVDLGYDYTGDADVSTPATLMNPDIDMTAVGSYLDAGANQGMLVSLADLGLVDKSSLDAIDGLYPYMPDIAALQDGALNDPTMAAEAATKSLEALNAALDSSTNPFIQMFGDYVPGIAANMADFYQLLASGLG